jgi:trans-2,3-dihydro-3-hydroxyanthranilate isomerase
VRSYRFLQFDVFTEHLFGGNQLAVFPDARGLSSETMQAIAKEMNFSETTFVLPSEEPGTDVRMRIFTPGAELPMAGHPTIGTTFALARTGAIERGRDRFVFGLGVGPTLVTMTWSGEDLKFAWMTQPSPAFSDPIADRRCAAAALGLPEAAIAPVVPVQVVSCGVPFVMVPLASRQAVDSAVVHPDAFNSLLRQTGTNGAGAHAVFVFATERAADNATAYSRMFAPAIGVLEDPATGSASGPLGCYLVHHGLVAPDRAGAMVSRQGVKMGRPSYVHMSIAVDATTTIRSVRVGGSSVLAGEGALYIP